MSRPPRGSVLDALRSRAARRRRGGLGADDTVDDAAGVSERLAVLLAAGVSPSSVWGYLLDETESTAAHDGLLERRLRGVDSAARAGDDVVSAIVTAVPRSPDDDAWRAVAAAWVVSTEAGAPLAPALRGFAGALREIVQSRREVEVALAGPLVSSRIVLALPLVAVGLGSALGFDVLGVLLGSVPGFVCLAVGGALAAIAVWWVRRLTAGARRADTSPGLEADLVAIAMAGGLSAGRAVALVDDALVRVGLRAGDANAIERILALSRRAGVPAGDLLRSEAEAERRRARTEGARRAARLGSLLMIPLGVCVLPAFMVLGIAPMILSLLSSTGLSW
ncbi:type II secretion system F family protein [Labedella phragmitis]|uniref:type II secretion system F family protein n=1 Tax=Labedella phragmitis TaxID=2498849 RepID=UPI0014072C2F|nr:type II secretion system F family protein [Labedella phragmitis]